MTASHPVSASGWPARYQIRVEGVLDSHWAAWFGGLQVESADTQTVISGLLADQPALQGLLAKIGDLGLCLISLHRLDPAEPETAAGTPNQAFARELMVTLDTVNSTPAPSSASSTQPTAPRLSPEHENSA